MKTAKIVKVLSALAMVSGAVLYSLSSIPGGIMLGIGFVGFIVGRFIES